MQLHLVATVTVTDQLAVLGQSHHLDATALTTWFDDFGALVPGDRLDAQNDFMLALEYLCTTSGLATTTLKATLHCGGIDDHTNHRYPVLKPCMMPACSQGMCS
jgi:hypothetical protein